MMHDYKCGHCGRYTALRAKTNRKGWICTMCLQPNRDAKMITVKEMKRLNKKLVKV